MEDRGWTEDGWMIRWKEAWMEGRKRQEGRGRGTQAVRVSSAAVTKYHGLPAWPERQTFIFPQFWMGKSKSQPPAGLASREASFLACGGCLPTVLSRGLSSVSLLIRTPILWDRGPTLLTSSLTLITLTLGPSLLAPPPQPPTKQPPGSQARAETEISESPDRALLGGSGQVLPCL